MFKEELAYLRSCDGADWIPADAGDYYLWARASDYYVAGRRAASIRFADGQARLLKNPNAVLPREQFDDAEFSTRLLEANRSAIGSLESESIRFIQQIIERNPDYVPVIPFSGGKDSLVVSLLVRKAMPSNDVLHVFGDTGIESPDTYSFIEEFRDYYPRVPLIVSIPNVDFFDMCELLGPPSRIKRWCCSTQKAFPLSTVYSALGPVTTFCGVRRSESAARRDHDKVLTDTKIADELMACPVIDWTDSQVWIYLLTKGIHFNRAYRRGFRRVGCIHCPHNSLRSELLKRHHYPEEAARWECLIGRYYARSRAHSAVADPMVRWKARAGGMRATDDLASMTVTPCDGQPDTVNVQLRRQSSVELAHLLRPFGDVITVYDDGLVAQLLVISPSRELLIEARHSRPRQHIRLTMHAEKSRRLLEQRLLRQMRKLSACVGCGACQMACRNGALHVSGDSYTIDAASCTHCLKCVTKLGGGCVAAHATNASGQYRWA